MQLIAWGWQKDRRPQRHWADKLGTTTDGSAISEIARQINRSTGYDGKRRTGPYIVLDISNFSFREWMQLITRHLADYRAPLVLHPVLLERFYPYLDDDASGHFQLGRGYRAEQGRTRRIGFFEPWNQQAFDPSEPSWRGCNGATPTRATAPTLRTSSRSSGSEMTRPLLRTTGFLGEPERTDRRQARARPISDVLLDTAHAVAVTSDSLEEKPAVATVIDLATGRRTRLDGRSDVPTTHGGTWALHGTRLVHATIDGGAYCLAEERQGFNNAQVTPAGVTVLALDDQRPSCRTLGSVVDEAFEPLAHVTECQGWQGAATDAGAVAGAEKQSRGGQAFLTGPRCGGDRITISVFAESADEQVSAPLG